MRALRILTLVCAVALGCGEAPPTEDITQVTAAQVSSLPGYYYGATVSLWRVVPPGIVQVFSSWDSFSFTSAWWQPGSSYWVSLSSSNPNVGVNCSLYFNWAYTGSYPPPVPANVPNVRSSGATHWVSSSGPSSCTVNGSPISIPAGAVEFWDTTTSYPAVNQPAGYFVWKIPGWLQSSSTLLRVEG